MQRIIERCAGIDVHQAVLVVCARIVAAGGEVVEHVHSFGATTPDLLALRDWLAQLGVTHVAMESTGVYCKAPYYLLEDDFELLLVNAAHLKHVPGRKTDAIDAAWIAEQLSYGLLRPSFVPPPPIRELRDLTRYRKALSNERTREVNRVHKLLEDAGVKLATVATDVMGVSGRAMLHALIDGVADPEALAQLAKGRLRAKLPALRKALTARFREHRVPPRAHAGPRPGPRGRHRRAVGAHRAGHRPLRRGRQAAVLDHRGRAARRRGDRRRGGRRHAPLRHRSAPGLVGGAVPRSARVGRQAQVRQDPQGSCWLRAALIECAHAAARTKGSYLSERYRQLTRRRGAKKAAVAVAHEILVAVWRLLSTGEFYDDPGAEALRAGHAERSRRRALRQLEALGYRVTLEPAKAA